MYTEHGYKPFAELTRDEVRALADELRAAAGVAPLARVAPVARAWEDLARALTSAGAFTVSELDREQALEFARRAWVSPPSLLSGGRDA